MYFILTVSLVLVLLHSRLGDSQLPYECRMANSSGEVIVASAL